MAESSIKSKLVAVVLAVVCAFGVFALAGCSSGSGSGSTAAASGPISVVSREDGSGTRGAFVELLKIEDSNGTDATTSSAIITNSTEVAMTTVAGDPSAIGYVSLGSLNDTVKAVSVDGVAPSAATVKDGTYKVARPFNVVTTGTISAPAQDFLNYILSSDGQKIVEDNGYVAAVDNAAAYQATDASGKVVVAGSSSVTPVMEKLAEAYQKVNPNVTVEVQQSDSSTGVQNAISGVCDLGMASRELKDSETADGAKGTEIALDGIAVVVNKDLSIGNLTSDQIRDIYLGKITDWSQIQ